MTTASSGPRRPPCRHSAAKVYEEIREQGGSNEKAARIANAAAARGRKEGRQVRLVCGKSGSYEDWTFDDLRKRVKELGLSGYSGKNKIRTGVHAEEDELISGRRLVSHSLPDVDDRRGTPPSRPVAVGR